MTIRRIPAEYAGYYLTLKYLVKMKSLNESRPIKEIRAEILVVIERTTDTFYRWSRATNEIEVPAQIQDKLAKYFGINPDNLFTHNYEVMV